jgi:hypothetical protein
LSAASASRATIDRRIARMGYFDYTVVTET